MAYSRNSIYFCCLNEQINEKANFCLSLSLLKISTCSCSTFKGSSVLSVTTRCMRREKNASSDSTSLPQVSIVILHWDVGFLVHVCQVCLLWPRFHVSLRGFSGQLPPARSEHRFLGWAGECWSIHEASRLPASRLLVRGDLPGQMSPQSVGDVRAVRRWWQRASALSLPLRPPVSRTLPLSESFYLIATLVW